MTQPKAQSLVNALIAQRDAALNDAAQARALAIDLTEELARLRACPAPDDRAAQQCIGAGRPNGEAHG